MKIEYDIDKGWVVTMDDDEAAAVANGEGSLHAAFCQRLGKAIDEVDAEHDALWAEQHRVYALAIGAR